MFLNSYVDTQLMCAYCEGLLPENAMFCNFCKEYKGVMTIANFQKIYGEEY